MEDQPEFVDRLQRERTRLPRILVAENRLTELTLKSAAKQVGDYYLLNGCELYFCELSPRIIGQAARKYQVDAVLTNFEKPVAKTEEQPLRDMQQSLRRNEEVLENLAMAGRTVPVAFEARKISDADRGDAKMIGAIGIFSKKDVLEQDARSGLIALRDTVQKQRENGLGV